MGWVTIDGNHVFIKEHTTQGGRSAGDVRLHVVAQEAANRVPASKRFGDKVWISDVHEEYQKAGGHAATRAFQGQARTRARKSPGAANGADGHAARPRSSQDRGQLGKVSDRFPRRGGMAFRPRHRAGAADQRGGSSEGQIRRSKSRRGGQGAADRRRDPDHRPHPRREIRLTSAIGDALRARPRSTQARARLASCST